jgi:hypothetical protein
MAHGCVEVRKDNHRFLLTMLTFYIKYLKCFFKDASMYCVSFIFNSNLCSIEMIHGFHYCIVIFVSYFNNDEKTLFQFCSIPIDALPTRRTQM